MSKMTLTVKNEGVDGFVTEAVRTQTFDDSDPMTAFSAGHELLMMLMSALGEVSDNMIAHIDEVAPGSKAAGEALIAHVFDPNNN